VVVAALIVLIVPACAAPSGGTTLTQGYSSGELSILNSPVTYTYDGVAGQDLNLYSYLSYSDQPPQLSVVAPGGGQVPVVEQRGTFVYRQKVDGYDSGWLA
jgi:hypothetical protein